MLAMFVPPVAWAIRRDRTARRRRARLLTNRCVACGYDLRATDGQCPECGADPVDCADVMTAVVRIR